MKELFFSLDTFYYECADFGFLALDFWYYL